VDPVTEPFSTYRAAFNAACDMARATGKEVGLERVLGPGLKGEAYRIWPLPNPENRYGHEARCEVVKPTDPKMNASKEQKLAACAGVTYSFANPRTGWYCYAHDAEGNQIGDAEYRYHKAYILRVAKDLAEAHSVPVTRDFVAHPKPTPPSDYAKQFPEAVWPYVDRIYEDGFTDGANSNKEPK
jgi:hypothetical protein